MSKKLKMAVNPRIINKIERGDRKQFYVFTHGFVNVEITLAELADTIKEGHPFCARHVDSRRDENFTCSDVLAVDIDHGLQRDQALARPFVQQYGGFIYTTQSHNAGHHRFRIVFELERTITSAEEMRAAYTGIVRMFAGDKSCTDACRGFYGSTGCELILIGKTLPNDKLDEIITLGRDPVSVPDRIDPDAKEHYPVATRRSGRLIEPDRLVTLDSGVTLPFHQASFGASLHCPVHDDENPSAYIVRGRTGGKGVFCHACAATFWMQRSIGLVSRPYDFYRIEEIVREREHDENPANWYDDDAPDGLIEQFQSERSMYLPSVPFLEPDQIQIEPGVTFIRSPKGSAKSDVLTKKVKEFRQAGKSVLLVGHRQILIQSLAHRFGLACYFFMDKSAFRNRLPASHYAICVNSMAKLLDPLYHRYDVVIIDESEQVFSHLTGSTLDHGRRACYMHLFHYLSAAESVIVCDADLGPVTVEGITQAIGGDGRNPKYRFYLNEYRGPLRDFHYYASDAHLQIDMLKSIGEGGRHYVATNSLNRANELHEAIHQKFGDDRKIMLVTSETVKRKAVQAFMSDIKTAILDFDVVIASPTIGTGIDITFDDQESHIDTVFGFFVGRINTHFDIDQQLSRVRHPKEVRVWVSSERYFFETEPDVIRQEAQRSGAMSDALIRLRRDGTREYDEPYLNVYANVMSVARASKNNLRGNLAELRRRNGWNVIDVVTEQGEAEAGRAIQQEAKTAVAQNRANEIVGADKLTSHEYDMLIQRGPHRTREEDAAIERHALEQFYGEDISENLVLMDKRGGYRKKIALLETYLSPGDALARSDRIDAKLPTIVTDRQKRLLRRNVLRKLLIAAKIADGEGAIDVRKRIDTGELGEFIKECEANSARLQDLFDIGLRGDLGTKPVMQLNVILGLMGLSARKVDRRTSSDGGKTNFYQINHEQFDIAMRYVERRMKKNSAGADDLLAS